MIYTSYYSNKALKSVGSLFGLVGISQGVPKWYKGEVFKALAPSWAWVRMKDMNEYTRLYRSQVLSKLDPLEISQQLDNSILLCWEKPGEFCHRRLVADWLEEATGQKVPEFAQPKAQLGLF